MHTVTSPPLKGAGGMFLCKASKRHFTLLAHNLGLFCKSNKKLLNYRKKSLLSFRPHSSLLIKKKVLLRKNLSKALFFNRYE